ncbi:MAG: TM2 domain-containing protein [Puniceicoccales bacterium]|jgi:TM2 domain-containing membrane protein YozV|nr:TM2 domain-containing protein [Puniceicoccales bacterium]
MDPHQIETFIAVSGNKFPAEKLSLIRQQLEQLPAAKLAAVSSMDYKDPMMILIVSILVGAIGIDRFLLGQTGLGIAKLLTCGGLGVWTVVDWFLIMKEARETNYRKFLIAANQ